MHECGNSTARVRQLYRTPASMMPHPCGVEQHECGRDAARERRTFIYCLLGFLLPTLRRTAPVRSAGKCNETAGVPEREGLRRRPPEVRRKSGVSSPVMFGVFWRLCDRWSQELSDRRSHGKRGGLGGRLETRRRGQNEKRREQQVRPTLDRR